MANRSTSLVILAIAAFVGVTFAIVDERRGSAPDTVATGATVATVATSATSASEVAQAPADNKVQQLTLEIAALRQQVGQQQETITQLEGGALARQVDELARHLEEQMAELRNDIASLSGGNATEGATGEGANVMEATTSGASAADPFAAEREHFARMDQQVTLQTIDPAWAGAAQETLYSAFAAPELSDARLTNVDCRSSMCRADLLLPAGASDTFALMVLPALAQSFGSVAVQETGEDGRKVIYAKARDDDA